jgi:tetratricopeptide (TPR) repeat protein
MDQALFVSDVSDSIYIGRAAVGGVRLTGEHEQLRIAEILGDGRAQLRALGGLGIAHARIGKFQRAIEFQEQSLAIAEELGDREGQAKALFNASVSLAALKDRTAAIARAEMALTVYNQIESPFSDDVRSALQEWRDGSVPRRNTRSVLRLDGKPPIRLPRLKTPLS